MEKRSRRRIRDLVTHSASQGLSENEIGCARISMMAKSNERSIHGPDTEAQDQSPPSLTSDLQHTAGPYKRVIRYRFVWCPLRAMSAVPRKPTLGSTAISAAMGHRRHWQPHSITSSASTPTFWSRSFFKESLSR